METIFGEIVLTHKTVVGFLSWLTTENFSIRHEKHEESIKSLSLLDSQCHLLIINNGGIKETKNISQKFITDFSYIDLEKNFFDISVHLTTYWVAKRNNIPYFIYTYDDFIFYDGSFIKSAEKFMDDNLHISCMRLPKYEHKFSQKYDTRYTPKSINPESISHHPGAGFLNLNNRGPYVFDNKEFYISNWRPISRPTLWRTESFEKFIKDDMLPIMQPFEAHMHRTADELILKEEYMSSFIDGGVCHTFPEKFSDRKRTNLDNANIKVSKNEIYELVEKNDIVLSLQGQSV